MTASVSLIRGVGPVSHVDVVSDIATSALPPLPGRRRLAHIGREAYIDHVDDVGTRNTLLKLIGATT